MILFHLHGGYPIYGFTLILAFGIVVGLGWVVWNADEEDRAVVFEAGCWLLAGSFFGSRVAYGLVHWEFNPQSFIKFFQLQLAGYSWVGALTGWLLAGVIYKRFHKKGKECNLDEMLPLAGVVILCLWIGSWLDGVAYGHLTDSRWGLFAIDEWVSLDRRIPLQWIGAISSLLLFWWLDRLATWKTRSNWLSYSGQISLIAGMGVSMIVGVISFFRADVSPYYVSIRMETLAALVIFCLLGICLASSFLLIKIKQDSCEFRADSGE